MDVGVKKFAWQVAERAHMANRQAMVHHCMAVSLQFSIESHTAFCPRCRTGKHTAHGFKKPRPCRWLQKLSRRLAYWQYFEQIQQMQEERDAAERGASGDHSDQSEVPPPLDHASVPVRGEGEGDPVHGGADDAGPKARG